MRIVNLTQHPATAEQIEAGVFDLTGEDLAYCKELLTFQWAPTREEMWRRADALCRIAEKVEADAAMIGGAVYFMPMLSAGLASHGIRPLAAFTQRVSVESKDPEGNVVKTSVFKHCGFVEM